jgi:hypothetical protein
MPRAQARTVSITSTKALPEPSHVTSALGRPASRQLRGVLRDNFFAVKGFMANALQDDAEKIQTPA